MKLKHALPTEMDHFTVYNNSVPIHVELCVNHVEMVKITHIFEAIAWIHTRFLFLKNLGFQDFLFILM